MSAAEPIAQVVADLRAGRIWPALGDREVVAVALHSANDAVVVDATAIYESLIANERPVWLTWRQRCRLNA